MRPQQQNRRIRGRGNNTSNNSSNNNNNNNNNRKGPNPLTRTYESNGPDVKIRGTAQQVAEKYTTLARDAQSSGDRVIAENYLQHAEHYNRIIATAQAQLQAQQPTVRDYRDDEEDSEGNEGNEEQEIAPSPSPVQHRNPDNGSGPQPVIEGVPAEVALNDRQRTDNVRPRRNNDYRNRAVEAPVVQATPASPEAPVRETHAASAPVEAPVVAEAAPAIVDTAKAGEKPVKRVRRPRVRKVADDDDVQPEEVTSES